jgi:6-phosphofructokinase 1
MWATRVGVAAVDDIHADRFGIMTAVRGQQIEAIHLKQAVGRMKTVDPSLYELAQIFY